MVHIRLMNHDISLICTILKNRCYKSVSISLLLKINLQHLGQLSSSIFTAVAHQIVERAKLTAITFQSYPGKHLIRTYLSKGYNSVQVTFLCKRYGFHSCLIVERVNPNTMQATFF